MTEKKKFPINKFGRPRFAALPFQSEEYEKYYTLLEILKTGEVCRIGIVKERGRQRENKKTKGMECVFLN